MAKRFISNAFSLQMIKNFPAYIEIKEVGNFPTDCISAVGHQDTANVLGVECNSINITLDKGDELFVAQLQGGRLPEGSTTLPDGFCFKFLKVILH